MQENLTEKVSVNVNISTLSQIDLLVDNGYYSNRSDFINQAVRQALDDQRSTLDRIMNKAGQIPGSEWFIGIQSLERETLEQLRAAGKKMKLRGYGLLVITEDCPDALVTETVEAIQVKGRVVCSPGLKAHFGIK